MSRRTKFLATKILLAMKCKDSPMVRNSIQCISDAPPFWNRRRSCVAALLKIGLHIEDLAEAHELKM